MPRAAFSSAIVDQFAQHAGRIQKAAKTRRAQIQLSNIVLDAGNVAEADPNSALGKPIAADRWRGCTALRTLRTLLKKIDEKGFERSPHQLRFHSAFERCTARIIYRDSWSTQRPQIMSHNGWVSDSSEVLISTPRRFGKTFRCGIRTCLRTHRNPLLFVSVSPRSIAIYIACMALSMRAEIVVFSECHYDPNPPFLLRAFVQRSPNAWPSKSGSPRVAQVQRVAPLAKCWSASSSS